MTKKLIQARGRQKVRAGEKGKDKGKDKDEGENVA